MVQFLVLVPYNGDYQNTKKVGRWDTFFKCGDKGFTQMLILLQLTVNLLSIKIGRWIELSYAFKLDSQVIYKGEYKKGIKLADGIFNLEEKIMKNLNRCKINIVNIMYKFAVVKDHIMIKLKEAQLRLGNGLSRMMNLFGIDELLLMTNIQIIKKLVDGIFGRRILRQKYINKYLEQKINLQWSGSYDDDEDSSKIGQWIDLSDESNCYSQITFRGEYKNNKKVGRWDTWYKDQETKKNEKMSIKQNSTGGGSYNEGIQIKQWIEFSDRSNAKFLINYDGEYINGKKVGRQDIYWKKNCEGKQKEPMYQQQIFNYKWWWNIQ
ncbi:unnamed protein product [Paramecium pentaurelia]|uniref:Uncharacterized protein n=1 Tax=Paramecium pentaurelia TaxID=43138 RepID=A0A8S1UKC7_9CILI|nr:unnamed protein product [Paramecium pentaurelia]